MIPVRYSSLVILILIPLAVATCPPSSPASEIIVAFSDDVEFGRPITENLQFVLPAAESLRVALHGGPPYQTAINQALRAYLRDRESSYREQATQSVLDALEDPGVRKKIREIVRK